MIKAKEPTVNVRLKKKTWLKLRVLAAKRGLPSASKMVDELVEN